jgi:hypothetical protein
MKDLLSKITRGLAIPFKSFGRWLVLIILEWAAQLVTRAVERHVREKERKTALEKYKTSQTPEEQERAFEELMARTRPRSK